jgi:hypothetical protein
MFLCSSIPLNKDLFICLVYVIFFFRHINVHDLKYFSIIYLRTYSGKIHVSNLRVMYLQR